MKEYQISIDFLAEDAPTFDPADPWHSELLVALRDTLRERGFFTIDHVTGINITASNERPAT